MKVILVVAFYIYAILNILAVIKFFKMVEEPRFRDDEGDVTTEVGYAEDPVGNVLHGTFREPSLDELEEPHIAHNPNIGAAGKAPF